VLGVEVAPIYGKFAFYDGLLGRFQFVVNAGAGAAETAHELKPGNSAGPATYGDTGTRFMGSLGAGFRVAIADKFTFRLEVRDLIYAARVDRVNGCSQTDLQALLDERPTGNPLSAAQVSGSCRVSSFQGTVKSTGYQRESDLNNALNLTQENSSDVLNNLGIYAGLGWVF
jgi:outer membrane beta-barrel protein